MKTKIAALTLLLLAGVAPAALAQGQDPGGPRPERGERPDHPRAAGHSQPPPQQHAPPPQQPPPPHQAWRPPAPPPTPPQAQTPPPAPQAHETRSFGGGQHRPDERGARTYMRRPGTWVDTEGDNTTQGLSPEDRADHEDRQELRDWRRFNGGRVPGVEDPRRKEPPRPDRRRADDHRGDRVQEGDRRSHDGPWTGGRPDGHRSDRDHDGDRDRHGRPEWRPGAYPPAFRSHHRYHVRPYRRPPHFYVRAWSFGEFLPPAWYGPEYLIEDWWIYGLPAPPYGYDWVRVGQDALLVDDYSGRIVQVVRYLFW